MGEGSARGVDFGAEALEVARESVHVALVAAPRELAADDEERVDDDE